MIKFPERVEIFRVGKFIEKRVEKNKQSASRGSKNPSAAGLERLGHDLFLSSATGVRTLPPSTISESSGLGIRYLIDYQIYSNGHLMSMD